MKQQSNLDAQVLEAVADALICTDRSGTIVRWNHASSLLFGFSPEEAVGRGVDLIIPEHLRPAHWKGFNAAINSGTMKLQGRPTITRALHKNGGRLYIEMTFSLVKEPSGEILGSVGVARDVTQRVERDRETRARRA